MMKCGAVFGVIRLRLVQSLGSMNNNAVGWFEIYVNDMARAKGFYEAVFAVTLEKLPGVADMDDMEMLSWPMVEGAGASGALVKMAGCGAGAGGTLVYFSCADCAVEQGRVVAAGGTVLKEKFPIGQYGFIAIVLDTEGNSIGLHSMV